MTLLKHDAISKAVDKKAAFQPISSLNSGCYDSGFRLNTPRSPTRVCFIAHTSQERDKPLPEHVFTDVIRPASSHSESVPNHVILELFFLFLFPSLVQESQMLLYSTNLQ